MKNQSRPALTPLCVAVSVLAFAACALPFVPGLGPALGGEGAASSFTSIRGQEIELVGSGLYRRESLSFAAQARAQDAVTLLVGIPLLLASLFFARRGSARGRLLLAGTFAYFSYTYATYAFGLFFNELFLVYVALLSLSAVGLILSLADLDGEALKAGFRGPRTRRAAIGFDFFVGAMLSAMWLSRIVPGMLGNADAIFIEHYTTLPIQVMDLAFVVPLAFAAGVFLAKDAALGYVLTGLFLMKGLSLGLALAAMIVWTALEGLPVNPAETAVFAAIIGSGLAIGVLYVRAAR